MRNHVTGRYLLFVATLSLMVLTGAKAHAQHSHDHMQGHAQYHTEFYSKWQQANGGSCCNDADCAPISDTRIRMRDEVLEVQIEGEWLEVSKEKIRPYSAPDLNSHLCHMGKSIFCFVYGAGM